MEFIFPRSINEKQSILQQSYQSFIFPSLLLAWSTGKFEKRYDIVLDGFSLILDQ